MTMAETQLPVEPPRFEMPDKMYTAISVTEEKVSSAISKDHYNDWPNDLGVIQHDGSLLVLDSLTSLV